MARNKINEITEQELEAMTNEELQALANSDVSSENGVTDTKSEKTETIYSTPIARDIYLGIREVEKNSNISRQFLLEEMFNHFLSVMPDETFNAVVESAMLRQMNAIRAKSANGGFRAKK